MCRPHGKAHAELEQDSSSVTSTAKQYNPWLLTSSSKSHHIFLLFFFFSNLVLLRYQPIIFHPTGLQATILQNCFHFNPLLQSQTLTSVSDSTDHSGGWKHSILLAFMTPLPTGCQSTSRATLHLDALVDPSFSWLLNEDSVLHHCLSRFHLFHGFKYHPHVHDKQILSLVLIYYSTLDSDTHRLIIFTWKPKK